MLVSQARAEAMLLLTHDEVFGWYGPEVRVV